MYIYYANDAFKVDGNIFNLTGGTTTNYAIIMSLCNVTSTVRGTVDNNVVNISSSSTQYGISIQSSNYYSANNNKITATGTSTGTMYPLYNYNTSTSYGKDVYVNSNDVTATGNGSMYVYGHYLASNSQFDNNKIGLGTSANTGARYVYAGYTSCNNVTANNNDITTNTTNSLSYLYAYYSSCTNVSFNNNKVSINAGART